MSKDQFKKPRARHTGADLFEQDEELTSKFCATSNEEIPRTHSLTMLDRHIEMVRDYVHHRKTNGDPYFTQGMVIQEALEYFFNSLDTEIIPRPEGVRKAEKRRTGRRRTKRGRQSNEDLF